MKLIAITQEKICDNEAPVINRLFDKGLSLLHLRKPDASLAEVSALLNEINPVFIDRIVLHDHFELLTPYNIRRVHLNRRNPVAPSEAGHLTISCSCHSLQELTDKEVYDYRFLSPVFDSISKEGYSRAFTANDLQQATLDGIINKQVIALGGISTETLPALAGSGFGGAAVLGALWQRFGTDGDTQALLQRFDQLKLMCEKI